MDCCSIFVLLPKCRHRFRISFYRTSLLVDYLFRVAFGIHFWCNKSTKQPFQNDVRSLQKSAALLAASGVLKLTAFLPFKHTARTYLRGVPGRPTSFMLEMLASFFALGRIFFVLGWFLNTSCTFLAHVGRFFRAWGRCGLDFGWSGQGLGRLKTTFADEC